MPRKGFPSDKQDQYMVRFPDGLRDRIKAAAEEGGRSMNAEIVARIEKSFGADREIENWRKLSEEELKARRLILADWQEQLEMMRWMREQQVGLLSLIESVAATDGNLSPDLMAALRNVVASRGSKDADK